MKKNVLTSLSKSVLVALELIAAASATDAAIQKNNFGSGMTILVFSNEEVDDIMKIIKSFKEAGLLIKTVSETVENELKEQKGGFLGILAATLGASLLGSMLSGKKVIREGDRVIRAHKGVIRPQ